MWHYLTKLSSADVIPICSKTLLDPIFPALFESRLNLCHSEMGSLKESFKKLGAKGNI